MNDRDRHQGGGTPRSLDEVLTEVGRDLAREVKRTDESTIIAYLAGTANELEIREVREAVACSPEFRDELVELKRNMDELAAPGVAERFDRETVDTPPSFASALPSARSAGGRAPAPPAVTRSRKPWFGGLFRRPAFAFGVLAALMIYPTYRYLAPDASPPPAPSGSSGGDPRTTSVSLFLREDPGGTVRGSTDGPRLPELEVDTAVTLVKLALEVPRASRVRSWHATLSDGTGKTWPMEGPLPVQIVDGDRVVNLELAPRAIGDGTVSVRLEEAGVEAEARRAVYRFVLVKRK